MASSKRWASFISSIASITYFAIIILQVPIFRIPCRIGVCRTPLEVTSSQLIVREVFPTVVVKALLYPGHVASALYKGKTIPSYSTLPKMYTFNNLKGTSVTSDLQSLEVVAGCYLAVGGAILGLVRPGRMSLFGILLVLWGLIREAVMGKSAELDYGVFYLAMSVAFISAFLTVRKDVRKIIRSFRGGKTKHL